MSERFQLLADIFNQALDTPAGVQREAFLKDAFAREPDCEPEIRRLLAGDAVVQLRTQSGGAGMRRFGPYRTRKAIGRGGMGVVYLASREDGEVRIEVAVKAIGSVLWSPALEERFRQERQILAQLRHPNIASFLDAGLTEEGIPYLVMEYVDGEPLDQYCQARRLSIRERLELFLKICGAVSFAHQQLVVHRDIKPSNVLVDATGTPKLLDFGVSRVVEEGTAAAKPETTTSLYVTPQYSSPNALLGKPASVTDDIYSLGVLLYELVSGRQPFGRMSATPAEVIKLVLDGDLLPASHIEEPDAEQAAAERKQTVKGLRRALRGDLDAITAKALNRSASRVYSSVEELASDVRLHLEGRPVRATAASSLERAHKFSARHKAGVAAAALVVFSIIGGLVATLWQARVAEQRFGVARELAGYLVFDLQSALEKVPSTTPLRAQIVNRSLAYLDRLGADKSNDDNLRVEVGHGYYVLADVLGAPFRPNLGEAVKARDTYRKAIAILEPVALRNPNNRLARMYLARSRTFLGRSLEFGGESTEGRRLEEKGVQELTALSLSWPADFEIRANAGSVWYVWARSLLLGRGFFATSENAGPALEAARHSVENYEAALRLKPRDFATLRALADCYNTMGYVTATRNIPRATPFFRQALTMLDQMSEADRQSAIGRQARGNALLALGSNLDQLGQDADAAAMVDEARRIRDRLSQEDPSDQSARFATVIPYSRLAEIQDKTGAQAAALANHLKALAILEDLAKTSPTNRNFQLMRADEQAKAAKLCQKFGRSADAERFGSAALSFYKGAATQADATHVEMTLAAQTLMETPVQRLRDPKLALEFMQRASKKVGNDSFIQEELGQAYWLNHDRAHAVQAIQTALSLAPQAETQEHRTLLETLKKYQTAPMR